LTPTSGARTVVCRNCDAAGAYAAAEAAAVVNRVLAGSERARLLLSTGESQFEFLRHFVRADVDWTRLDCFHLDEYVGLSETHPASFRHYLQRRFADLVPARMHYVDPSSPASLNELRQVVEHQPMDLALVGVGENGHIAFNDPPADMDTTDPYIVVNLDTACRAQQVREGWFSSTEEVPAQAVTMSVQHILRSRQVISVVPHSAKAGVIRRLLTAEAVSPDLPASALLRHEGWALVLDRQSAQFLPANIWKQCVLL
jgi:glucosamine-6-phosphate deaminase